MELFVKAFQPEMLLINPHLYLLFDQLVSDLLLELPIHTVCGYVHHVCLEIKAYCRNTASGSLTIGAGFVWLKNAARSSSKEVANAFE